MDSKRTIMDIIAERHSNRTYQKTPIRKDDRDSLEKFLARDMTGPFGNRARFSLVAAADDEAGPPRKLGTYGVIRNAPGFIAGAVAEADHSYEDYGYLLEGIVLYATGLGLGTCWLGGTFSKSGFARSISLGDDEVLPAIVVIGYSTGKPAVLDSIMRYGAGSKNRKPWESLFFNDDYRHAMAEKDVGAYAVPLDMVRRAPSAANKQPWRIVREGGGNDFHFFLQRTNNYKRGGEIFGIVDLQRVDIGIAMKHFEAAAAEIKLKGAWKTADPGAAVAGPGWEYIVTWKAK